MRRALAVFCWLGLTPLTVSALGLGDIALDSALNQPFSAQIPLESYEEEDLKSLRVGLASSDTFERYGLDLPVWMQGFQFAVAKDDAGKPVVRISSLRPVAEPFVTLLLDIKWSSGRLLREYTVLLDPPLFEAAPAPVAVAPAETTPAAPTATTQSAGAVSRPRPAPVAPAPAPARVSEPVRTEPVRSDRAAAPAPLTGGTYTVQRRETLWGIADRVRGDSAMTVNQVMLALYRANPDAFLGNINRLKAGAILRVPDAPELASLSPAEATAAVREQNAALRSPQPAAAATPAESAKLTLVAPDRDAAEDSTQAGVPADTAGRLDAAASNVESGRMQSRISELESELGESRRLLEARDAELAAMQRRLAVLEAARDTDGGLTDGADEVMVEDDLFATEEPQVDADEAGAVADASADTPFADEPTDADESSDPSAAEAAAETAADEAVAPGDPTTTVAAREEQPSFFSSLLGNIWFWISAAVVLLLALFVARRGRQDDDEGLDAEASGSWRQAAADADHADTLRDLEALEEHQESIVVEEEADAADPDSTSRLDDLLDESPDASGASEKTTELQLPDQGDTETPLEKTISTGGLVDLDQADPIAEAEFHMAYGLYDQAAELLERSLEDDPDNREYRAKLIEVFFVWENRDGFLTHARALHERIGDESDSDWNKVVILGKQLCPDDQLFSGEAAAPAADSMDFELTDLGDDAGDTELDFTLGGAGNEVEALDADLLGGTADGSDDDDGEEGALDFDLGDDSDDADELALDLGEDDFGDDTDDSATTMESPTVEADMADAGADTLETPTIESPAVAHGDDDADVDFNIDEELIDDSASTMETPTIESDMSAMNEPTLESPTLESAADGGDTSEMPALDADSFDSGDIDLDLGGAEDLDVDLSGLGDDLAETGINESDDTEAIATEGDDTAEIPVDGGSEIGEDDATLLASGIGEDDETLVTDAADLEAEIEAELEAQSEASSDTVEQPQIDPAEVELGETAEQPAISESGDVDFDLGMDAEAEDDVATAIQEASLPEDATMTEVGTKLDLARAYIDMGDPDGARSILNEVLDEGGDEQQQEARQLLEELGD